jgi:general secretion pathway protein B
MSLILDALKKLDREKLSRRKGMPDLAAEVLRPDPAQSPKRTPMYIFAVFLTALATAGITYAIIAKPGFLTKSSPPSTGIPPAPGQQVASASPETGTQAKPSAPIPVIPPAPGQKDAPTAPGIDSPAKPSLPAPTTPPASRTKREAASAKTGAQSIPPPPARVSPPAAGQQVAVLSPKPSPPAKPSSVSPEDSPEPRRQAAPSPPSREPTRGLQSGAKPGASNSPVKSDSRPPALSPGDKEETPKGVSREARVPPGTGLKPGEQVSGSATANPPPLKISGIVWNEEPSKRRAVVNGSFATEGSVIEGVKVVEIFATKVRFLHQGRYFEISVF